jgi:hypothetical protein
VGECAGQLASALFNVVQTLKNTPYEIAGITQEISLLSRSLVVLVNVIKGNEKLCKPAFQNTNTILLRYNQIDAELRTLTGNCQGLRT